MPRPGSAASRGQRRSLPELWIVWVDGGVRNPRVPTMFQVADCDAGDVRWINADEATRLVLSGLEGMSIQADCLVCDR